MKRLLTFLAGTGLLALQIGFAASPAPILDPEIQGIAAAVDSKRIDASIQKLVAFGTRNTCSSNTSTTRGIGAARNWIRDQFAAIPGMNVQLDSFNLTNCGGTVTRQNVIAWLPGATNPNRIIVIGGHYDSRTSGVTDGRSNAPGANDSGSQAAAVLEIARVMAGKSYDATLVFAAWAGEEQGLLGSSAFVRTNFRKYFPNGTLELNLNCDIIGGDNTANGPVELQQFRLYSPGTPREIAQTTDGTTDDTSPSRGVMRHVGYWGSGYVPAMTILPKLREDRVGRGGDHESFISQGIPGVRFIEPIENLAHQHSPNDLYSFVTPAYTARVAQVMAAAAASLAKAGKPPATLNVSLSGSNIQASWTAPAAGPAVHHYVVGARLSTDNFYQARVTAPATALSATLGLQQDLGIAPGSTFYVSVAAVDAFGHESLFAYPEYRCTAAGCSVPSDALNVTASN
jgi:hypothetical protein